MAKSTSLTLPTYVFYIHDTGLYFGDWNIISRLLGVPRSKLCTHNYLMKHEEGVLSMVTSESVFDLWACISRIEGAMKDSYPDAEFKTLYIIMPCGFGKKLTTFDDYPWKSLSCPCGNTSHKLIDYSKEKNLAP